MYSFYNINGVEFANFQGIYYNYADLWVLIDWTSEIAHRGPNSEVNQRKGGESNRRGQRGKCYTQIYILSALLQHGDVYCE